jgi:hypothetical protein
LKPAWANSSLRLYLKKPFAKKGWWSGSRCSPEFKTHYCKKKKKFEKLKARQIEAGSVTVSSSEDIKHPDSVVSTSLHGLLWLS